MQFIFLFIIPVIINQYDLRAVEEEGNRLPMAVSGIFQ
jgi:hypothetical protein